MHACKCRRAHAHIPSSKNKTSVGTGKVSAGGCLTKNQNDFSVHTALDSERTAEAQYVKALTTKHDSPNATPLDLTSCLLTFVYSVPREINKE